MDRGAGDKGEQETKGYLLMSLKTMAIAHAKAIGFAI